MPELFQLGHLWNLVNWATLKYIELVHPGMPQEERYRRLMVVRTFFNPELAVGQHEDKAPAKVGKSQFQYLKKYGLKPEHIFLDYGCGALRLGRYAIPYLRPGHYYGVDISKSILVYSERLIRQNRLESYAPTLQYLHTSGVPFDRKFDYIVAQSVFTHTDSATTITIMRAVAEHMHADSKFLATFWITEAERQWKGVNYYYPREKVKQMAVAAQLRTEFKDDYVHPSQRMVVFSKQ